MARSVPRRRRLGQLDSLVVENDPQAPTVVLFHGYGADMNDLAPLADVIQAPRGTNWVFPNGHQTVPLGGHYEGRGWFPISLAELEKTMQTGQPIDMSTVVPPGFKKARELARGAIEALGVPMEKLVVGGFSQGGMLATELVMNLEKPPAALAILSGTLVSAESWRELAVRHAGYRFFQSHGARDPVLPFAMAQNLESLLTRAGWRGRLQRFEGGHEIPAEVLIQLGAFLRQVLA